jgi:hypothetical protein
MNNNGRDVCIHESTSTTHDSFYRLEGKEKQDGIAKGQINDEVVVKWTTSNYKSGTKS